MVSTLEKKKKVFLYFEFFFIYLIIPIIVTSFQKKIFVYFFLYIIFFLSIILLKQEKFLFKSLLKKVNLKSFFIYSIIFFLTIFLYTYIYNKRLLFSFPLNNFEHWFLVMLFYPIISVLPQEIIYRVLFMKRYARLFKYKKNYNYVINAFVFSYGHLVFGNIHALILTALSSSFFLYEYKNNSFLNCFLLHMIGGQLIFTVGLGEFFFKI